GIIFYKLDSTIMRLPAQKPARAHFPITRSPAQKSTCKDHMRNGQSSAKTPEATYTPTSNRAGSRSHTFLRRLLISYKML
ncbi:hypothetical protein, partial [Lacticaseibacillus rhamnosus]|uniref:hypothetical protein n=1 Tax=Lacticaseibacillus rhamnosus TaxID=47715 RepID=UPI001CDD4545